MAPKVGFVARSLRRKLNILIVTPMILTVVICLAAGSSYQLRRLEVAQVERLRSIVQALAQDFARVDLFSDQSYRSDLANRLRSFPSIEHVYAFDLHGERYYYYAGLGLAPIPPPPVQAPFVEFKHGQLHVFEEVKYQGREVGTIYVRSDASIIVRRLRRDLLILGFVGLSFASFTFFVSRLLQKLVTSPVESLSALVREVTHEQNYTLRSSIRRDDELGQLARGVNDLLSRAETSIEELETKNAELERFTYTVSHDLKSPLVTIRGFAGMLEKDLHDGQRVRVEQDLDHIKLATEKMHDLLSDLLALSRVGRVIQPQVEVSVGEVVAEATALLSEIIRQREVKVTVAGGDTKILVDRGRMLEVFQNLIENAVKFMGDQPDAQIVIEVRGEAAGKDGKILCQVRDNGIGIDPRYQSKIFGLFNKLEANAEGSGVGLALVKRIVEVHGGDIWVESAGLGQGSTFSFTLPPGK